MDANPEPPEHNLPESTPGSPQNDMETLFSLQNQKVQLTQERDALEQRKLELEQAIKRHSTTLSHYKDQQLQYETKQKLDFYLHQNNHEITKLSTEDENASFVLDNLDVLPSREPSQRLALIGKFYPQVNVHRQSISTIVSGNNQYNKISYVLSSEGLPSLTIELLSRDEKVHKLTIANLDDVSQVLHKISPTLANALVTYYQPEGRIDLLMYSFHSLAHLQAKRIEIFSAILAKHQAAILRPQKSWSQNPTLHLMCLDYIEIFFSAKNIETSFRVRLRWDLVLSSRITGEIESRMEFSIRKEGSGLLPGTNAVFITLASTHGVEQAFHILTSNLFEAHATQ